ncbi:VWA domain-containing protein [Antarcticibacterium sp. 1MA-6-2]|uniref:vWA domain-containing protein n=1 Tax=Antarcticibacterium sp. 1MA-6-2 TaxID=2908210 RepID=UPI001F363A8D|nr:VWA domain-containing protein [Antarcticibacterium sp. 1MA-6-2]UJH91833.1 VWA domain-containing protein [Antarcticibacterium sp. 1MA-6-2]
MQFHNPEVLYALFLLVIPVIVHLFQLRKFQRENFTNVKFLKKLSRQTRKSSRLKKWLVLATRLLLLSCIIFAFSRPFFPGEMEVTGEVDTLIYLDNSYSMQAEGQRGKLLERSVQELLESLPNDRSFFLMTNDEIYPEITKADLQNISYSANNVDFRTVLLRAENYFTRKSTSNKKLLLISDFQQELPDPEDILDLDVSIYSLPLKPENFSNVSLDSVYFSSAQATSGNISVHLSFMGNSPGNVPVSFFQKKN